MNNVKKTQINKHTHTHTTHMKNMNKAISSFIDKIVAVDDGWLFVCNKTIECIEWEKERRRENTNAFEYHEAM